jgi:tripartite-type tricarboxylate transporter receptor subunit TctC
LRVPWRRGWRIRWASPSSWKTAPVPTAIWARPGGAQRGRRLHLSGTAQSAYTINPALYSRVPFDPIKDFTPVMQLAVAPYLLVVNPNFPAKNLDELVAYAKAHPGKVEYASAGNGTLNHLLGEMLKKQKNVSLLHVPYKGRRLPPPMWWPASCR